MAVSESLVALLQEQLEPLGRITLKRMFSGAGVYCDGRDLRPHPARYAALQGR